MFIQEAIHTKEYGALYSPFANLRHILHSYMFSQEGGVQSARSRDAMFAFAEESGGKRHVQPDVSDSTLSTLGGMGLEVKISCKCNVHVGSSLAIIEGAVPSCTCKRRSKYTRPKSVDM